MPRSSSVTLLGGVNEIGGNKILIEDRGTRIFLDFGKSYAARSAYYDWMSSPRTVNGIGDFLALGILPEVSGIYREDLLKLAGLRAKEDRFVDALVLSHAHSDHADYVSFLREDIPIWMGETSKDIIESLEAQKDARLEFEITRFKDRSEPKKRSEICREIHTFNTRSGKFKIDSMEVEPVHVDHSLPGCYGFIIRTSNATIVYSGDLRMHGNRSDMTREFVQRAKDSKPDLMLCEGTRVNEPATMSEQDVHDACLEHVKSTDGGFVFAHYSYKDVDRFTSFHRIAKETERKLVITPTVARYLEALSRRDTSLRIPKLDDPNIVIYKPREKTGSYSDSDYEKKDRPYYNRENSWTAEKVKKYESQVIMAIGSYEINELIDVRPRGGIYLHSTSEPFNEEGEIDEARMRNWLRRFDLTRVFAHCSGHASGADIDYIINEVAPKMLVPIHTVFPNMFRLRSGGKVKLAGLGEQITI